MLPPIDATCRSIGRNVSTDIPFTPMQLATTSSNKITGMHAASTNGPSSASENCRSAHTNDVATTNGPNNAIPTGCINEQKGDNSSSTIATAPASASTGGSATPATTSINYNLNMTANRTTGQPKLPALESKTVVPSNCK